MEHSRVLDQSWQALETWGEAGRDQEERGSTERENRGGGRVLAVLAAVTHSPQLVHTRAAYPAGLLGAEEGPHHASSPASGICHHPWCLLAYRRTTPISVSVSWGGVPVSVFRCCENTGDCLRATLLQ